MKIFKKLFANKNTFLNIIDNAIIVVKCWLYPVYIKRQVPVVVYTFGSCGTTSLNHSLKQLDVLVFSVHFFSKIKEQKIFNVLLGLTDSKITHRIILGYFLYRYIKKDNPVKMIISVRNPIDKNIASFFRANHNKIKNLSIDKIKNVFLNEFEHDTVLNWFDDEVKNIFDFDIYNYDFCDDCSTVFKHDNIDILIIKIDSDIALISKAVNDFLDIDDFKLLKINTALEKDYCDIYVDFKQNISLPDGYVEKMLDSKYSNFFRYNEPTGGDNK